MSLRTIFLTVLSLHLLTIPAAQAFVITGQVTDAANSHALAGAVINADDFFAHYHGSTTTDNNGNYQLDVTGNPLFTVSFSGYVSQTDFANGATTLNFALVQTGTIVGTVRSAGAGIAGESLQVSDALSGNPVGSATSEDDGSYSLDLPPGQYAVCILNYDVADASAYADQCYDGKNVPGVDGNMDFTTISLASGQNITGVDFALTAATSVSGTVRDSFLNAPIANKRMYITLYSSTQNVVRSRIVTTDANGAYTATGLTPASYYIVGQGYFLGDANSIYTPLVYRGAECTPGCTFPPAALTAVPAAGLNGVDFNLFPGRIIKGRVTDANTGTGIAGVAVEAGEMPFGSLMNQVTSTAITDGAGNYTLAHLAGQNGVHVATYLAPGYIDLLWLGTPCAPSNLCVFGFHDANSIDFSAPDQIVTGIDFALQRGASVSGRVTMTEHPAIGVADAGVGIYFDDGQNGPQLIEHLLSAADGSYSSDGWTPGTYYVAAWYGSDCEFYGAIPCAPLQTPPLMSVPAGAQAIVIGSPGVTTGVEVSVRVEDIFYANFE
jgi:Carboxypeptidase regulatory-like domain